MSQHSDSLIRGSGFATDCGLHGTPSEETCNPIEESTSASVSFNLHQWPPRTVDPESFSLAGDLFIYAVIPSLPMWFGLLIFDGHFPDPLICLSSARYSLTVLRSNVDLMTPDFQYSI